MRTRKNTVYKKSYEGYEGHGLFDKTGRCILFIASGDTKHFIENFKNKKDSWHLSLVKYANKNNL